MELVQGTVDGSRTHPRLVHAGHANIPASRRSTCPVGCFRLLVQRMGEVKNSVLWQRVTVDGPSTRRVSPHQIWRWTSGLCRTGACFGCDARMVSSSRLHAAQKSTSKSTGRPFTETVTLTLEGKSMAYGAFKYKYGLAKKTLFRGLRLLSVDVARALIPRLRAAKGPVCPLRGGPLLSLFLQLISCLDVTWLATGVPSEEVDTASRHLV